MDEVHQNPLFVGDRVLLTTAGGDGATLVTGYELKLRATTGTSSHQSKNKEAVIYQVADGRVYTVQVCATDAASHRACQEVTIGIKDKNSSPDPISQGKAYVVASDAGQIHATKS